MSIRVINVQDEQPQGEAYLLYGRPKVGKTTLIGTLPEGEMLLVDVDGGRGRLRDAGKRHAAVSLKDEKTNTFNLDLLKEVYQEIVSGSLSGYRYVVLDSVSELEKHLVRFYQDKRGKDVPELKEYGDAASKLREIILRFRDLREMGKTVFFVAWESPLEITAPDGSVTSVIAPLVQAKFAPALCGLMDHVGRVVVSPKSGQHGLTFKSAPGWLAGSRNHALTSEYGGAMDLMKVLDITKPAEAGRKAA